MRVVSVYTGVDGATVVDLSLPAGVPLAALIPDIADLAAVRADDAARAWQLSRVGGSALDGAKTLAENGITDGDGLMLEPVAIRWPRFERDDWTSRIVAAAPVSSPAAPVLAVAGSVLALVGSLLCAVRSTSLSSPMVLAAIVGLSCGVALTAAMAARSGSMAATPLSLLTVALGAACGVRAVPGDLSAAHILLAASAATVTSLALLRVRICRGEAMTALTGISALSAVAALGAVSLQLPTASAGALLTVLSLATLSGSPRLSVVLAGLAPAAVDPEPTADADECAASGHRILAGLVDGAAGGATLASAAVVIGTLPGKGPWVAGAAFCAVTGLVLLLRARTFLSGRCRWSLAAHGTCCLAASSLIIAFAVPHHAPWVGMVAVCSGVWVIMLDGRGESSPVAARAVDVAEYVAIAAVVPLACAVLDLFGLVRSLVLT